FDDTALGHGHVFGVGASLCTEDVLADVELCDASADLLDSSCELRAEERLPRPPNAGEDTCESVVDAPYAHRLAAGHGRGVHPHQPLIPPRHGPLHVVDAEDVRWPVTVVDDRSHAASLRAFVRGFAE